MMDELTQRLLNALNEYAIECSALLARNAELETQLNNQRDYCTRLDQHYARQRNRIAAARLWLRVRRCMESDFSCN